MKYLITGGGTGGHIYPALAIASEIKRSNPNADILYIGTKSGLEAELVPKAGFEFKAIRVKGMPRRLNKSSLIALRELMYGLSDSKKLIREYKPDIVIGTGGYVSGPVVYMAKKLKVPALIHEQNVYPGITNKILSRFVDKIAVTFDDAKQYFKHPEKVVNTGNPIRGEILKVNKKNAYDKLKINPEKPFILSFGGSGGQKKLNECFYELIKGYKDVDNYQLIHVTGARFYDDFMKKLCDDGIIINSNIRVLPYFYEMPDALNIADLIVTSAGAITLAEISAVGVPSILIPKAYTAENHQEFNARTFQEKGASVMILEKDLSYIKLRNIIDELINNKQELRNMSLNSKKMGKINAARLIVAEVDSLLKKK
ncbi:undecaprenyldiphospho-muramoylpentapeptide beta-N-acetylglucosaminyltransferase [Tissierella sp. Yu-01]|uniref:undecaprenyldiphospho-muramoylpentapeptide beta-N-acetylglucosaminyltransferase n=1 Tax=Tissierella sp. Yu-01 TaxID=3035694 RepID=UPI00240D311B|nr:undecaprenyldiphospho-muramoylpentapeptide beta-N-acetylglucosaminyltransferase [Tissierella sp. Yu-01]WFA09632.1 undecaprenyldiphospho-muramoylpentapeptide beta-N-acetylglucosaminyltransferase [Tissierella sp. Yu-01]